jgi:hypothetical protein
MTTKLVIITLGAALVLAACGDASAETVPADSGVATATSLAPTSTVVPVTTTIPDAADASTTVPPVATTKFPPTIGPTGEQYDFWVPVPSEGAILGVVGVHHDDTLNIRSGPHVTFDVIATLEPIRIGIAGTGEGWQLPSGSVWWKIEADGVVGWAEGRAPGHRWSFASGLVCAKRVVLDVGQRPTGWSGHWNPAYWRS